MFLEIPVAQIQIYFMKNNIMVIDARLKIGTTKEMMRNYAAGFSSTIEQNK